MSVGLPIDAIKRAARIDEVAARYTQLHRRGSSLVGLCPLHDEKTPSFTVAPDKGVFYCFGCGAGGDVIELVQRAESLDFVGAASLLAKQYGVELEDGNGGTDVVRLAWSYMQKHAEKARGYLERRGITGDFPVGYDLGDWLGAVDHEAAKRAGILRVNSRGAYSPFRDRVVFPVRASGVVIGLTGRDTTGKRRAKWFHSHFSRNSNLFLLDESRRAAVEAGFIVVVEGPLDALKIHSAGLPAVAVFGASLSQKQARKLAALGVDVYVGFDRDAAGLKGVLEALEALRGVAIARVVTWPQGVNDPGELDAEGIVAAVGKAVDPARFLFGLARWKYRDEVDRMLKFLAPWLAPANDADPIPTMLAGLLNRDGIAVRAGGTPPRGSVRGTPPKKDPPADKAAEAVRLLEADIAAVLISVHERDRREPLIEYVESRVMPDPGELLTAVLAAMRSGDPLTALRGAGGIFYKRVMEAPEYTPEEAAEKLRFLVRSLSIKKLEKAKAAARSAGDFDKFFECSEALEAVRRSRR